MNIVSKVTGDSLTANEFNQIPDEMENLITSGGISPSDLDLQQITKAIAQYCADGNFYVASGTPDAIILSTNGTRIPPVALTNGFKARFKAVADNTGNCTINVANLGAKSIYFDGNQLQAGEIKAGNFYEVEYDFANDYFVIKKEVYQSIKSYDILSSLVADTTIKDGDICVTSGYYSVNDGGAGLYTIREQTVADVENGGSIIFISNSLVAELVVTNSTINIKQFGAKGDNSTDDITAIQNAVNTANTKKYDLHFNVGTYLISQPIDIVDKSLRIFGEGVNTTIKANANITSVINIHRNDFLTTPIKIENLTIDGNNKSSIVGIDIWRRPKCILKEINIQNCDIGLDEGYNFLGVYTDVQISSCRIGHSIDQQSNGNLYLSCGCSSCTEYALYIKGGGGSSTMSFINCDYEFSSGAGIRVNQVVSVFFICCHIGEQVLSPTFIIDKGDVVVQGGFVWVKESNDNIITLNGGNLTFQNSIIMSNRADVLFDWKSPEGKGKIKYIDCNLQGTLSYAHSVDGDCLDTAPFKSPLPLPKYGKNWTMGNYLSRATIVDTIDGNVHTMRCTAKQADAISMAMYAQYEPKYLSRDKSKAMGLIIVYKSYNVAMIVASRQALWGAGTALTNLPPTTVARTNNTEYKKGWYVLPETYNGYTYKCITAGTSGNSAPIYPTTIGDTVTDGTCVWECCSPDEGNLQTRLDLYVGGILPNDDSLWGISIDATPVVDSMFSLHEFIFLDGDNREAPIDNASVIRNLHK